MPEPDIAANQDPPPLHRRRKRYAGKYPRQFDEKYKERNPAKYSDTVAKVLASGKTPAGAHRPVMVEEVMAALSPQPGQVAVDCTLGYGGHAEQLLARLLPGGRLIGIDTDPIELEKTRKRLELLGHHEPTFTAVRTNFAALPQVLANLSLPSADLILADLGVSSMQLDDPARGFSWKSSGPLDMRLNPQRGQTAAGIIKASTPEKLTVLFSENADEPNAVELGAALAGRELKSTQELASAIRAVLRRSNDEGRELAQRRVFQALRIAVNDEFSALETFLKRLPECLSSGGRAVILTFHSGEDRRVKKHFQEDLRTRLYSAISEEVTRPSPAERQANSRSTAAKLRWAVRASSANRSPSHQP
jgi:16S rRNA (cytosine1402-N4)-methyltransferase